jgi:DNA-binding MarR family transcriptional regulator
MDLPGVFDDLVRVEISLWAATEERLRAEVDLPMAQLEFLRTVDRRGACRVGDIAEDLDVTVGGTSKVVDRLEARGLVERAPNPDDRRSSLITVTEAGATALRLGTTILQSVLEARLAAVLHPADLDALASALAALRAARPVAASATPTDRNRS